MMISLYKAKMSCCVCLSVHASVVKMIDLRAKPMTYLESTGSCGCVILICFFLKKKCLKNYFVASNFPVNHSSSCRSTSYKASHSRQWGIELSVQCFTHCQLYVAASRDCSTSKLFRFVPNNQTCNVGYPEALQNGRKMYHVS